MITWHTTETKVFLISFFFRSVIVALMLLMLAQLTLVIQIFHLVTKIPSNQLWPLLVLFQ